MVSFVRPHVYDGANVHSLRGIGSSQQASLQSQPTKSKTDSTRAMFLSSNTNPIYCVTVAVAVLLFCNPNRVSATGVSLGALSPTEEEMKLHDGRGAVAVQDEPRVTVIPSTKESGTTQHRILATSTKSGPFGTSFIAVTNGGYLQSVTLTGVTGDTKVFSGQQPGVLFTSTKSGPFGSRIVGLSTSRGKLLSVVFVNDSRNAKILWRGATDGVLFTSTKSGPFGSRVVVLSSSRGFMLSVAYVRPDQERAEVVWQGSTPGVAFTNTKVGPFGSRIVGISSLLLSVFYVAPDNKMTQLWQGSTTGVLFLSSKVGPSGTRILEVKSSRGLILATVLTDSSHNITNL